MTKMKYALVLVLFSLLLSVYAETTFFDQDDEFIMVAGTSSTGEGTAAISPAAVGSSGGSCAPGYNFTQGKCVRIMNESIDAGSSNETIETPITPESNQSGEAKEKLILGNQSAALPATTKENWPRWLILTIIIGITLIFLSCILLFWRKKG